MTSLARPKPPSSVTRHMAVADAIAALRPLLPPARTARMAVADAIGLSLAAPVVVASALPAVATALRDGWAVASADTIGASAFTPAYPATEPAWVAAGQALPPGCDAVLPAGLVARQGRVAAILESCAPGENVRAAGADASAGLVLARAGQVLTPALAAACAAAGRPAVEVARPAVRVSADADGPEPAILACLLASLGAAASTDRDPGAALTVRIGAREAEADPPGAACRARIGEALALSPGAAVSLLSGPEGPLILCPPGLGPVLAVALALIAPLLGRPAPPPVERRLTRKVSSRVGWTELVLLAEDPAGWRPLAVGDSTIDTLAQAAAWSLVDPESEGAPAGALWPAHAFAAGPLGSLS